MSFYPVACKPKTGEKLRDFEFVCVFIEFQLDFDTSD